jgi:hypothetical protein
MKKFLFYIRLPFGYCWHRLKIVLAWLPIIAEDEDDDYHYILRAMQFKIRKLRLATLKENRHTDVEEQAALMLRAEEIIEKILKDDYGIEKDSTCSCKYPFKTDDAALIYNDENPVDEEVTTGMSVCASCINKIRLQIEREDEEWKELMKILSDNMRHWWI